MTRSNTPYSSGVLDVDGRDVDVRIYYPGGQADGLPSLIWLHGGGFRHGSLDMVESDLVAREVSSMSGHAVICVDYVLASPTTPYPIQLTQLEHVWHWLLEEGRAHRLNPDQVRIGGASAGGNLATALTLALRFNDRRPIGLVLAYPVLDWDLPHDHGLAAKIPARNLISIRSLQTMFEAYAGTTLDEVPSGAMPGRSDALASLPATLIITAELDAVRSSGRRLAASLGELHVPHVMTELPGALHGFLDDEDSPAFHTAINHISQWLSTGHLS